MSYQNVKKFKPKEPLPRPIDTLGNMTPKVVFDGIRDGQSSISLKSHHEALREARTVKGITRTIKQMEKRELLKLLEAVNKEVRKRGLSIPVDEV